MLRGYAGWLFRALIDEALLIAPDRPDVLLDKASAPIVQCLRTCSFWPDLADRAFALLEVPHAKRLGPCLTRVQGDLLDGRV